MRQSPRSARARRLAFAQAYLAMGFDGSAAAISVGYSPKTAGSQANQLLKNIEVQAYLREGQAKLAAKHEVSTDNLMLEFKRLGFSNIQDFARIEDGLLVPDFTNATREQLAAVESFTLMERTRTDKDGNVETTRSMKLKMYSKIDALVAMGKHIGMFVEDTSDDGSGDVHYHVHMSMPEPAGQAEDRSYRNAPPRIEHDSGREPAGQETDQSQTD